MTNTEPAPMLFEDFLTKSFDGYAKVSDVITWLSINHVKATIAKPTLTLPCLAECDRSTYFDCYEISQETIGSGRWHDIAMHYNCRHCRRGIYDFAMQIRIPDNPKRESELIAMGKWPPYHERIPEGVLDLTGSDRELFLKGWKAERAGLGIGAYTYYRRVIEDQKNRIIERLIDAASTCDMPVEARRLLEQAKKEQQFASAIDLLKQGLPESLRLKGHEPISLLYSTLSGGIHEHTDGDCLDGAKRIRLLLTTLAARIQRVLDDEAEVNAALSGLLRGKQPSKDQTSR